MNSVHSTETVNVRVAGQGRKSLAGNDRFYRGALFTVVGLILAIVVLFVFDLVKEAIPGFKLAGWGLFGTTWSFGNAQYGALPLIAGTLVTTALALLFAVPVGLGTALALVYVVPQRLRLIASSVVELLAVVPSIVYGIWGALTIEGWLSSKAFPNLQHLFHGAWPFNGEWAGQGIALGSIVLAIMILPIVTAVSRDVIASVPKELTEGALSLGATRSQVIRKVVLPSCRTGIVGAITLATGRALGETIALATLLGGVTMQSPWPDRLFATGSTLAAEIAIDFGQLSGTSGNVLFALAIILMLIVGGVTYAGRVIVRNAQRKFQ
jgi:phosphate transport system permease protein